MLSGVKIKHILGYNEKLCSQISSVFKKWIVCDYEIWLKKLKKENVSKTDV